MELNKLHDITINIGSDAIKQDAYVMMLVKTTLISIGKFVQVVPQASVGRGLPQSHDVMRCTHQHRSSLPPERVTLRNPGEGYLYPDPVKMWRI